MKGMKTKQKKFEGLKIWVDNLVKNETYITAGVLADRFNLWLKTKDYAWLQYYWFEAVVRTFLTTPAPGCQGTFEEKDFYPVYDFLKPMAEKFMQGLERIAALRAKNESAGLTYAELAEFQNLKNKYEKEKES